MLVVVSANQSPFKPPPAELAADKVVNESLIYDATLLPAGIIAPAQVVNDSTIYPPTLLPVVVHTLSPAQVVNASTINVQTLQSGLVTSYDNPGGKGNRTALITVTTTAGISAGTVSNLVDGAFADVAADSMWWGGGQSGRTVTFDFGSPVLIQEAKHYSSTAASHGTWKWRGSHDNAAWTDLSANFNFAAGLEGFVQGNLSGNQSKYRYYQIFQVSGTTSSNPWQREWEFKIAA